MEGGDREFAKFRAPALKAFLTACGQSVSGNKQELVARAIGCPCDNSSSASIVIHFPRPHWVGLKNYFNPERRGSGGRRWLQKVPRGVLG